MAWSNDEYQFTTSWSGSDEELDELKSCVRLERDKETHILEIGSYEGRSAVWFIINYLSCSSSSITCVDPWIYYVENDGKSESIFRHNIKLAGRQNQVIIHHGYSANVLPKLLLNENKYDVIFIDGNHLAANVLFDAVCSFNLLNANGYMIFDDYLWKLERHESLRPKKAIDYFIDIMGDKIRVVLDRHKKVIQRI